MPQHDPPFARFGTHVAHHLVDVTSDPTCLDSTGFWAVHVTYEGDVTCARFSEVTEPRDGVGTGEPWWGPKRDTWATSLDRDAFTRGVDEIRSTIARGDVYQVNLTRRLSAPLEPAPPGMSQTATALAERLAAGNPAPHAGVLHLPDHQISVVSASPELYLRRSGLTVSSSPIKGTAATEEEFLAKDRAENVMIVDLVRNDLGRICSYGSVRVPELLAAHAHPGLVHLVSTVSGELHAGRGWRELLSATFPAGSITGAPKLAARGVIERLEPVERGIYCGSLGWVDADRSMGELNVAIRTFWFADDHLHFGTGGGITWDSTPDGEWAETELKAAHLIRLASR